MNEVAKMKPAHMRSAEIAGLKDELHHKVDEGQEESRRAHEESRRAQEESRRAQAESRRAHAGGVSARAGRDPRVDATAAGRAKPLAIPCSETRNNIFELACWLMTPKSSFPLPCLLYCVQLVLPSTVVPFTSHVRNALYHGWLKDGLCPLP